MTSAPPALPSFDLDRYLEGLRTEVDAALEGLLPPRSAPPPRIHEAMRYAIFAGGKRLRPILVLAGCEAAGSSRAQGLRLACAVECVHTYSLVHDDLPALDDDDLRRGRPTLHKAFDEATAILAGDALLTFAIETALGGPGDSGPAARFDPIAMATTPMVKSLRVLVGAIGTSGMIGGQVDDLLATGAAVDEARVRSIHARKTGALLRACPVIGGILAEAPHETLSRLDSYGADVGLAFQIVDDILDVEGTASVLGKSVGKDAASGKATFPAAIGIDASKALAAELSARAAATARALGPRALPLAAIAEYVVRRER